MKQTIPRRIIQIWSAGGELPLFCKCAAASVKLQNPEFEYTRFNEAQMRQSVAEHFPEYENVYRSFRVPVQRYDFFRYLEIYRAGGFYFDLDVFFASSLTPLLSDSCVFPFETITTSLFLRRDCGMDWEVGNYGFGASPGHPFIRAVIENCVRAQQDPAWAEAMVRTVPKPFREDFYVLYTTGPWLVSRTLAQFAGAADHVRILFPDDVFNRDNWSCFGEFGVHLMKSRWRTRRKWLRKKLLGYWETYLMRGLMKESRQLGKTRTVAFFPQQHPSGK